MTDGADRTPIPLSVPVLHGNEWRYVKDCLDSNWISSSGAYVERFEAAFAARLGGTHAVACASGTAALHVALIAAGVTAGDLVATSAMTFVATANAIRYVGAEPLFVDADPDTWQMDPRLLAEFLSDDCETGAAGTVHKASARRVGAVVPVHILGHPADMDPIVDATRPRGIPVVEDATESLGARYKGRPVGTIGELACFSFNGNKMISTGGGGMVATADADRAAGVRHLTTQARADGGEYVHDRVGYNYRLPNVLAAIGCAQLEELDGLVAERRRIAAAYAAAFADTPGIAFMPTAPWAEPASWLSTVRVDAAVRGEDSRAVIRRLAERGIESRPLWQPMHRSPAHAGALCLGGRVADALYDEAVSLPSTPGLSADDQRRVVDAVLGARA